MFPFWSQSELIFRKTRRDTKVVITMYKLHDEVNEYDNLNSLIY